MNTGKHIRLSKSGPMAFFSALFATPSGFFRHGLSSLFLLSIFAAGAIPYGAEASELCWYITEDGLGLRDSNDTIRKYGVFNDPISAVDAVTPQAIVRIKAALARQIGIGGFPCKLTGATSDVQSSYYPPGYVRYILVEPIPTPNSYGSCFPFAVSANSIRRSSMWHAAVGIPPDVRDILIANCSSDDSYTIKLSKDTSPPTSGDLAEVEPGKATTTLRATVYDNNNQPVPNVNVKLEVTVEANSGGHQHNDNRPKGLLSNGVSAGIVIEGNTGSGGMPFTFLARPPAGDHKIIATCTGGRTCKQEGSDKVWVGIRGLVPFTQPGPYVLVGFTPSHPANSHNLKPTVSGLVRALANVYRSRFPQDPVLHLNDASLERGGLFDSDAHKGKPWRPPHSTHRKGTDIDIRWNTAKHPTTSIPDANADEFKKMVTRLGGEAVPAYVTDPDNKHFHVQFGG